MQSVGDILARIESGAISAAECIADCRRAIEARDGAIGAFERLADPLVAGTAGPLAGIAVGVKDIVDTADMETELGSDIWRGNRPRADAALVAMLRARGAAIVGKTVTTEFAFLEPSRTRNPRDTGRTPGGSSSGSAAAVAAGMVPAAVGTQTGGSVVRPAAYCGVAGYKPSFRLLPLVGVKTFSWSLDTAGLFAAGVADVAEFAARLTGRSLAARSPGTPPRIGLYRSAIWREAEPAMRAAVGRAADIAATAGAEIVELAEPEELTAARDAHGTIQNHEAAMALAWEYDNHRDRLSPVLREALENGRDISPEAYDAARRTARIARRRATALFERVDVLLTPSAPGAAPRGLASTGAPIFNKLWTLTGNPCVNVPGLVDGDAMPLGVQLVARFGRDAAVLAAGAWLETCLAGAAPIVARE